MVNTLTKGVAKVGKIVGQVAASAGQINSTELASLVINSSTLIATGVVTSPKVTKTWSALTNTTKGTSVVPLPAAHGGYAITQVGSSQGIVISSTVGYLSVPSAGDWYEFFVVTTPSTIPIHIQSTGATFDGTNKNILMNAVNDYVRIEALSTVRWLVTNAISATVTATT